MGRAKTTLYLLALALTLGLGLEGGGVGAAFTPSPVAGDDAGRPLWTTLPTESAGISDDAPLDMSSFSRLAKRLMPAVVGITVTKRVAAVPGIGPWGGPGFAPGGGPGARERRDFFFRFFGKMPEEFENKGVGSGFVIHADGFILTNSHVIENADEITVRFPDGRHYPARVVGADPPTDIALLHFEPEGEVAVAPLGDSDRLEVGEWVMAIGNPFGLSHTVTAGIVSAKGRSDITPGGRRLIASFIQTDASINPGNSGGPLFNTRGEVIGMATAINAAGQGIGFAIPVNMVKTLLPQLRRGRVDRSWLGVMIRDVTDEHVEALGLPSAKGAIIAQVVEGGPADRGGIRAGDVVVAFDGQPIESTVDLQWRASTARAGTVATIAVYRRGERKRLRVELGTMPDRYADGAAGRGGVPESRVRGSEDGTTLPGIGFRVSDVTPSLRHRLNLPDASGVVVVDVDRGSPASRVGILVGDRILVVGTQKVRNVADFEHAISRVRPGQLVSLVLSRNGETLFIDFRRSKSR